MVVADRSVGYAGSLGTADWAVMNSFGRTGRWCVLGADDLRVSQGTGDRALRVAAGRALGDGVLDEWDAGVDLAGAPVGSGSRWDTVVLRRDWDADETSVAILQGGSAKALAPTLTDNPGYSRADQPIAFVRFAADHTAVQEIIDLRTWTGDGGGMVAASTDALGFLDALGTQVTIGATRYTRVLQGGSAAWQVESLVQDTGVLSPVSSTWSGGLRWMKNGQQVTLQARAQRVGSSLSSPVNGVMYSLPSFLRPSQTPIGFNASRLNSGNNPTRSSDLPIRVEQGGQVRFYVTETSGEIVTGNYLYLNTTYWTAN